MNRISSHIISAVILVLLFFIAGCSKNFLEKPKGGAVTADTIFHTKNQARLAVAQMYNTCIHTYFPTDWNYSRPGSITDEVYLLHGTNDTWAGMYINTNSYVTGIMSQSGTCDWGGFGSHYNGIRHANLILENIDRVTDADASWIKDVKGQALFCRAIQHFELFRYYGGIPIVNHALQGNDLRYPRRSVQAVVDSIVSWCDKAAVLLPLTRSSIEYGMITKLAALALKSRVLLYAASPLYNTPDNLKTQISEARFGDHRDSVLAYPVYSIERWKRAADAAKDVLDNAPVSGVSMYNTGKPLTTGDTYETLGDYESVSNVFANKELILTNTLNLGNYWWSFWMSSKLRYSSWGIKNNTPIEFIQLYEKKDGTKWTLPNNGSNLPDDIQNLNLDPRFYQTIAYDGMRYNSSIGYLDYYLGGDGVPEGKLSGTDGVANGFAMEVYKFVPRVDNMAENHFAWPIFRLAEFYLSYAEALNEYNQGPNSEAYNAINITRTRAGMPSKSGLNVETFRDAIQNERTVELAFENHRYNDLLRWLKAPQVLNQALHGIITTAKMNNGNLLRPWKTGLFIQRVFPIKYYYLPFSNEEISKKYLGKENWNGQNPGW